jgi:hypothetical protein
MGNIQHAVKIEIILKMRGQAIKGAVHQGMMVDAALRART